MAVSIIQIIAIFTVPALIIKYRNFKLTKIIGMIGSAYLLGILVALIIFLFEKLGLHIRLNKDIGQIGRHAAIGIAIPLLLFSSNLRKRKSFQRLFLYPFLR
ncbi:MAG: hypothetical protein PHT03_04750 [Bacilli bacterium]|nr:hypothetical protein [Bacilli bacterium]